MALHRPRVALLLIMGGVEEAAVMLFYLTWKIVAARCWVGVEDDEVVVRSDASDGVWFDEVPRPRKECRPALMWWP